MTTKWRPEGWFNEYENAVIEPNMMAIKAACLELGADRMLEALRKEGMKVTLTNGVLGLVEPQYATAMLTKGKLIFIPDDKE